MSGERLVPESLLRDARANLRRARAVRDRRYMATPPREESLWQGVAVLLLMAAAVLGLLFVGWAGFGPVAE